MNAPSHPETIAGFEITGILGQGGMGAVYKARHPRTGAEVAIKVILGHLNERPEVQERFRREVRAMATVEHPNMIRILEAGEEGGNAYYVMQLVDGVDLATLTSRKGRVAPQLVHKVAVGCLEALGELHANGIIHRDLKPHNVMLDRSGRPLLMDLGLTKIQDAKTMTKTGALIGSPRYMPPELLTGKRSDARSDIYQLGLILWECATAETAVTGDDFQVVATKILHGEVPPLLEKVPDFPPALAGVIHRCIAVDPAHRFPSAQAALDVLEGRIESDAVAGDAAAPLPGGPFAGMVAPGSPGAGGGSGLLRSMVLLGSFLVLFGAGFWLTGGPPATPPEDVRILWGADRVAVRWRGAAHDPVRLIARGPDGKTHAAPPEGAAVVSPGPDGYSQLVVSDLEAATTYEVYLEHSLGKSLPRPVTTIESLLPREGIRLLLGADGNPSLELELEMDAASSVTYPRRGGGTRTAHVPPSRNPTLPLADLDLEREYSSLSIDVEDGIGGKARLQRTLGQLLERIGREFTVGVADETVEKTIVKIEKVFRNQDDTTRRLAIEGILAEEDPRGFLGALEGFLPFAAGFFGPHEIPSELRIQAVHKVELLRRLERCAGRGGVSLTPSPGEALQGNYSLVDAREGAWEDRPLEASPRRLSGFKDPVRDHGRVKVWEAPLPPRPLPAPPRVRLSLRAGKIQDVEYLRVQLPGGLTLFLFGDGEERDEKGVYRRTFDPRDVPDGGRIEVTYHDAFDSMVASEVGVTKAWMGWPEGR